MEHFIKDNIARIEESIFACIILFKSLLGMAYSCNQIVIYNISEFLVLSTVSMSNDTFQEIVVDTDIKRINVFAL